MLHSEHTTATTADNNNNNNDSKISVDSDLESVNIPQTRPPFRLRVINPDIYEQQDNEASTTIHHHHTYYQTTLVPNSVSSTPELRHAVLPQQPQYTTVVTMQQMNDYLDEATVQQQQPTTVTRKVSKILVEQPPVYTIKPKLELLPPLETLPPLIGMNESHLLSSASTTPTITTMMSTTLNQISPLEALSNVSSSASASSSSYVSFASSSAHPSSSTRTRSPPPPPPPPTLPQHQSFYNNEGNAQQSMNKTMVISTVATGTSSSPEIVVMLQEHHTDHVNNSNDDDNTTVEEPPIMSTLTPATAAAVYQRSSDRSREQQQSPRFQQHTRSLSITPSITGSVMTTHTLQQQHQTSRYSKASYSLTNHPDAIKLYRTMAIKTNDPTVQLTYAKYLLEVASLYDSKRQPFRPNLSLSLPQPMLPGSRRPSSVASSRRSSIDTHVSLNTLYRDSASVGDDVDDDDDSQETAAVKKKKQKMLQQEGVHWIKKLAKKNRIGEAAYLLGLWYQHGMYGCRKSLSKAIKFYEIAAEAKVPEAMFAVGQYHEREQDYMTCFKLYEEAAGLGLVEALYRIAMIHLNGEFGSRRNVTTAIEILMRASEKSTGTCPEAPYTLGLILTNNYPSVNIPSELIQTYGGTFAATTYLEYAAEMGMSAAQYRLGYIYEQGLFGIRIHLHKAFTYYEMAAATTTTDGYAMLALSRLYNQGVQVPPEQVEDQLCIFQQDESGWTKTKLRDEEKAFKWCHLAAVDYHIPDAYYLLGWYFEMGIGVPKDLSQAYQYYAKAAKKGKHVQAQHRLDMLETAVKHQKNNEKRRTMAQHKRASSINNLLNNNVNLTLAPTSKSEDARCTIM